MSRLSGKQRKALPKSAFAGPGRSFPIPDKSHARAALRDAPKSVKAGNLSKAAEKTIVRKADAKLGKSKGSAPMAKKSVPAALKAHEFKKGHKGGKGSAMAKATQGDLAKGKPAKKHHAKAAGAPSFHDHVVKKFGGGSNPGRK